MARMTIADVQRMKAEGRKLVVLTAYYYEMARALDRAAPDMILVGDSGGRFLLGHSDNNDVTMDEMVLMTRSVCRGAEHALVVGDLPFMSYQVSVEEAIRNAGRLVKETRCHAVKLEGGAEFAPTVRALVQVGISVMAHTGLTPMTSAAVGGYTGGAVLPEEQVWRDAQALQDAGAFSVILTGVPPDLATRVSKELRIPVISGAGAGDDCDGQIGVAPSALGWTAEQIDHPRSASGPSRAPSMTWRRPGWPTCAPASPSAAPASTRPPARSAVGSTLLAPKQCPQGGRMKIELCHPRVLLGLVALLLVAACQPAARSPQPPNNGGSPAAGSATGAGSPPQATNGGASAGAAGPAGATQPGQAAPAKLLIGKTGQGAELQFWPIYVGQAQGFFAQEGVDVEMITVPAAYTATQALIAGDVQMVGFTVLSMAAAVVGGAPLKLVASNQDLPSIRIVARPEITSWDDLKGKAISSGNTSGDYFDVVMRMVLRANGLNDDDYTMRTMPGAARLPALQTGQVAAALLSDYDSIIALRDGYKSFGFVQDYVKDIQYSGYVVDDNWAKANEATLVSFLRGLLRSTAWLFDPANRDAANQLFLAQGPELGIDQVERIYDQAVTGNIISRTLRPNMKGTEAILKLAHDQGALPEIPPDDRWIDLSYLDKASR